MSNLTRFFILLMAFTIPSVSLGDGYRRNNDRDRARERARDRRKRERDRQREEHRRDRERDSGQGRERDGDRGSQPASGRDSWLPDPSQPRSSNQPEVTTPPSQPEKPSGTQGTVPAAAPKGATRKDHPRMIYAERLIEIQEQNRQDLGFAEQEVIMAKIHEQWLRKRIETGKTEDGRPFSNMTEVKASHTEWTQRVIKAQLKYSETMAVCNSRLELLKSEMPEDAAAWDELREKNFGAPTAK